MGKAQAFASEFGFQRAYGSYEELYDDPEVEMIYIATPHNCHYEQVSRAYGYRDGWTMEQMAI